jgi:hypothetical protein
MSDERYQTDTRQPRSRVGYVTQEEHVGKLRRLEERHNEELAAVEARVRAAVEAEYAGLVEAARQALGRSGR